MSHHQLISDHKVWHFLMSTVTLHLHLIFLRSQRNYFCFQLHDIFFRINYLVFMQIFTFIRLKLESRTCFPKMEFLMCKILAAHSFWCFQDVIWFGLLTKKLNFKTVIFRLLRRIPFLTNKYLTLRTILTPIASQVTRYVELKFFRKGRNPTLGVNRALYFNLSSPQTHLEDFTWRKSLKCTCTPRRSPDIPKSLLLTYFNSWFSRVQLLRVHKVEINILMVKQTK